MYLNTRGLWVIFCFLFCFVCGYADALEGRTVRTKRSERSSVPRLLKSKTYRWPLLAVALAHM